MVQAGGPEEGKAAGSPGQLREAQCRQASWSLRSLNTAPLSSSVSCFGLQHEPISRVVPVALKLSGNHHPSDGSVLWDCPPRFNSSCGPVALSIHARRQKLTSQEGEPKGARRSQGRHLLPSGSPWQHKAELDSAVLTSQGALSKAADGPSLAIRQLQGLLNYLSLVHPPCPLVGYRGQKRLHPALSLHVALQLAFTYC